MNSVDMDETEKMEKNMQVDIGITTFCNWVHVGGCDLGKAWQASLVDEDDYIKPSLDEILHEDLAVLLKRPFNAENCELKLLLSPPYKINSLTIVCNVSKLELFLGTGTAESIEYYETIYGNKITDEVVDNNEEMVICRYDIRVRRPDILEMNLKLIAQIDEIVLYGIFVNVAESLGSLTKRQPTPSINLDNVETMLSNTKISQNAEMLKKFLHSYAKKEQEMTNKHTIPRSGQSDNSLQEIVDTLKAHIDVKMDELEKRLMNGIKTEIRASLQAEQKSPSSSS